MVKESKDRLVSDPCKLGLRVKIERILDRYSVLFKDELGCVEGIQAKIIVAPNAVPKFHRSRTVPFAIRDKIEKELDRLESQGVIESVRFSEWSAR